MPQSSITITASSDMDLLIRKKALEKVNKLPTDQLNRVLKLIESAKALTYLASDLKFAILQKFL